MQDNYNIIKDIPPIPEAFYQANEMIKEQGEGLNRILSYFEENTALRDEIIKAANSRYYTIGQTITTIRGVILTLGVMKFKNIVMVLSIRKLMDLDDNNYKDLWIHSLKCAIACEILANENSIISSDDAFSLGFLHDIGKIILYKNKTDLYRKYCKRTLDIDEDIIQIENDSFMANHAAEGSMILKKWRMPRILIDCITYHHTPTLSTIPSASGIIYIADKIVNAEKEPNLELNLMNRLGL